MVQLSERYKEELKKLKGTNLVEKLENLAWRIKAQYHLGLGVVEGSADNYERLLKEDEVREIFESRGKSEEYESARKRLDIILYSDARTNPLCRKKALTD